MSARLTQARNRALAGAMLISASFAFVCVHAAVDAVQDTTDRVTIELNQERTTP